MVAVILFCWRPFYLVGSHFVLVAVLVQKKNERLQTYSSNDSHQVVSFNQKFVSFFTSFRLLLVNMDNGSVDILVTLGTKESFVSRQK